MMTDIDLSGVDPVRVPEIRRRVAILDEYVALHRPSPDLRRTYADRLRLSVSQLYHLARVWRISREAASIPGARSRFTKPRPRRIDPRSLRIAREEIERLGPTTPRAKVLEEVSTACRLADVTPPSASTTTNLLAAARTAMSEVVGAKPELLIDEVVVKLPVRDGDGVTMPRVLLAVALPQRRIVAAEVSCSATSPPSIAVLMRSVEESMAGGAPSLPIRAPRLGGDDLPAGDPRRTGAAAHPRLVQVLGDRLADLGLLYRTRRARPGAALAAARHASPLEEADARRVVLDAIAVHNSSLTNASAGRAPCAAATC